MYKKIKTQPQMVKFFSKGQIMPSKIMPPRIMRPLIGIGGIRKPPIM